MDDSGDRPGAAYVFVRSGATWSRTLYVKASNPGDADEFGSAVALSGDTFAFGAQGESSAATGVNPGADAEADDSAERAGAVYVVR